MRVQGDPRAQAAPAYEYTQHSRVHHSTTLHYTALHCTTPHSTVTSASPPLSACHIDTLPLSTHTLCSTHTQHPARCAPRTLGGSAAALRPPRHAPAAFARGSPASIPGPCGATRGPYAERCRCLRVLPGALLSRALCVPSRFVPRSLPRCLRCLCGAVRDIRGAAAGPGGACASRGSVCVRLLALRLAGRLAAGPLASALVCALACAIYTAAPGSGGVCAGCLLYLHLCCLHLRCTITPHYRPTPCQF